MCSQHSDGRGLLDDLPLAPDLPALAVAPVGNRDNFHGASSPDGIEKFHRHGRLRPRHPWMYRAPSGESAKVTVSPSLLYPPPRNLRPRKSFGCGGVFAPHAGHGCVSSRGDAQHIMKNGYQHPGVWDRSPLCMTMQRAPRRSTFVTAHRCSRALPAFALGLP